MVKFESGVTIYGTPFKLLKWLVLVMVVRYHINLTLIDIMHTFHQWPFYTWHIRWAHDYLLSLWCMTFILFPSTTMSRETFSKTSPIPRFPLSPLPLHPPFSLVPSCPRFYLLPFPPFLPHFLPLYRHLLLGRERRATSRCNCVCTNSFVCVWDMRARVPISNSKPRDT